MYLLVSSAERGDTILHFFKNSFKEENKAREYMEYHSGLTVSKEEFPDIVY